MIVVDVPRADMAPAVGGDQFDTDVKFRDALHISAHPFVPACNLFRIACEGRAYRGALMQGRTRGTRRVVAVTRVHGVLLRSRGWGAPRFLRTCLGHFLLPVFAASIALAPPCAAFPTAPSAAVVGDENSEQAPPYLDRVDIHQSDRSSSSAVLSWCLSFSGSPAVP